MFVLAGILVTLGAITFVLAPLALHIAAPLKDGPDAVVELGELYALKDLTYETIHDIEFDYHAGKITEADYRAMTGRYSREAAQILGRIEALEAILPRPTARRPEAG
jgi:hypothetical protein